MKKLRIILTILAIWVLMICMGLWYSFEPKVQYSDYMNNKELDTAQYSLELKYYGFACPCPQWITPKNEKIYDSLINLEDVNIMIPDSLFWEIEPQKSGIPSPFEVRKQDQCVNTDSVMIFRFVGSFYKYPQKIRYEGEPQIVKVFQYSSVECR